MTMKSNASWLCVLFVHLVVANANSPNYGSFIGTLSNKDQGISGQLYCIDESTVYLRNFTYTGKGSVAIFVYGGTLGADGGYTKTGYPLRDVKGAVQKLERSDQAQNHVLKFPKENTLMDIDWLGLIDRKNKALYSRVLVDEKVKASIPKPLRIAPAFQGRNGLKSREIEIVDSRTFVIRDFSFKGRAPDTHFLIGVAGTIPNDIDGYVIPNEKGSHQPLGSYDNQTIILSIPSDKPDLNTAKWLSIWSQKIKLSLAHVLLPAKMNVPPSLDTLGAEPEPSLNCEELDADLGLELRWTLSEDEIILQLVSNTGDDRYLALGIRDPSESKGIAGDVVVGWISSSSGKGGLDDYFLAGKSIPCDDGAESCPDKSKGGTKDIELLNAVSRANYTMLTFKRPIKARGDYDVDILVNTDQYIFWSVGYKSAAMRNIHKPLKNLDPIAVNFGRKPLWNCMTAGKAPSSSSQNDNKQEHARPASQKTKIVDEPRRRIATASILTPPNKDQAQINRMPVRPTRRPVRNRNRVRPTQPPVTPAKNSWTDWFSPPTKPEVNGGGFVPRKPANPDWSVPNIGCGETADEPLYVHLGPATTTRGNQGLGADGTALYINGLLAPELTLQRGKEYTFVVETGVGSDPGQTFHPFYITSDPAGGRQLKTELEARAEKVYGGISVNGQGKVMPSAMGKLCRWTSSRPAMTFANFLDFHNSLELKCESDHASTMSSLLRSSSASVPSVFKFKPDNTMPDELFYQSFMAKHLGNKIHIKDYCYSSQQVPQTVTTYRPSVIQHLEKSELLTRAETRREQLPFNRRIDEDAYDYDYNSFDNERDLLNKCKRRSRVKGRSLDSNLEMPTFEHFPMRDIIRTSGIDETLPSEEECRRLLQNQRETTIQNQAPTNDFPNYLKFDKSGLDSRFNPNQERIISRTTRPPKQREWTTPMGFMKTRLPSNPTTTPFMASTTTPRAILGSVSTPSWNTAKPEFNPYQLDPSLLHNGFLFDKRKMMESRKPQPAVVSTRKPSIFRNTFANKEVTATTRTFSTSVTFKPRLTTTTTMPTLPPPGGDVPSYMSYVNEAKAQFEANKQKTNPLNIEPPILKKIPMPLSSVVAAKKDTPVKEEANNGPLSMLSGMFMPSWFQDNEKPTVNEKVPNNPPVVRKPLPIKNTPVQRVQNGQGMPLLPPPKNFPSFDNAKRKARPPPQIMANRQKPGNLLGPNLRPKPPPPRALPKSSKIAVGAGNYADFVRQEFQSLYPTKPPVQLIPRKNTEFISPYANYYPKRHLKIVEKKKGLLEQILSLPEKLPKLPYLSSSVSVPSVETGNSTTTEISQLHQLIDDQDDMTEEEKELLKKLTEEPTSVSADLLPKTNSFGNFAPNRQNVYDEAIGSDITYSKPAPKKTSLGLGFDPTGIEPESGFRPIVEGQGSSIPTLAFSVLDGAERPPVSPSIYEQSFMKRQNLAPSDDIYQDYDITMDRGVTPVNVPAPVVPYVPPVMATSPQSTVTKRRRKQPSSADFSSFGTTERSPEADEDYVYDMGYVETDRIDPPVIDPNALVYSANSAPYGEQYPSYLPKTLETMVGTMGSQDSSKHFAAGDNVFYGKFPEGADASKDLNIYYDDDADDDEYYEDDFEYYYEDDLMELKSQLGIGDSATSETKMSFLQLLQNLQNKK